tara:strand:+ start:102 stop:278 length:177 start_codon:yes stop_codon:yes gene_type:complete
MNMAQLKTVLVENEQALGYRIESLRSERSLINKEIKELLVEQKANDRMLVAAEGRTRK